ncbi:MAG: N-acetylmuramic acid 6-phosphate etherase [Candidatus Eisenbacteria bacterium]
MSATERRTGAGNAPDRAVFDEIARLATEQRNPRTMDLDSLSTVEVLERINHEDQTVAATVRAEIPYIAQAVDLAHAALVAGGRILYVGAGTSGRLGVLDASECPPTFGVPPEWVQGIIAGGYGALLQAVEGAEDRADDGAEQMRRANVEPRDFVVGIAASRRTPFVVAALAEAARRGARTALVTCTPREEQAVPVDVSICPVVGPEVIMGSTRMKSGTAQKLVLNMLTTATMVRLGKVYENMMVDLMATSQKLVERGRRTLMTVTDLDYEAACARLDEAGGSVKVAIVMTLAAVDAGEAQARLERAGGFVRAALESPPGGPA